MTIEQILADVTPPGCYPVPAPRHANVVKVDIAGGIWTFLYDDGTRHETSDRNEAMLISHLAFPVRPKLNCV